MLLWIDDILLPYLEENDGGPDGEPSLLVMDPARPHLTPDVRARLKEIKVDLAIMPASTTYKFQLIDVAIGGNL